MKKYIQSAIVIGSICTLFACGTTLSVQTSKNYQKGYEFEETDLLQTKKNVGIAFSGGGSRSASATIGQLRGLMAINVLDTVKYISSVSGGSWAATSYTYSPYQANANFLGEYLAPDQLTMKKLNKIEKKTLPYAPSHAHIFRRFIKHTVSLRGDEIFSALLHDIYFKRIGLKKRHRFMAYNEAHTKAILQRQKPHYTKFDMEDFMHVTNTNKPYLIVNGTVVGGARNTRGLGQGHIEFTPLYSGQSSYHLSSKHRVGGGYIETFGLDTKLNTEQPEKPKVARVTLPSRKQAFSPTDAMGISGNAPGTWVYRKMPRTVGNFGLPEINLWSVHQFNSPKFKLKNPSAEFILGDGGNSENLGVIPLLKRKVKRIIVFANSKQPVCKVEGGVLIDESIVNLFGEFNDYENPQEYTVAIQLFSNAKGELDSLKQQLARKKKNNEPLIVEQRLNIHENEEFGVYVYEDYKAVDVLWIYNDNLGVYYDDLPEEFREALGDNKFDNNAWGAKGRGECDPRGAFPFLSTAVTNKKLKVIDYKNRQVNLLAHLSDWVIRDNEALIKSFVLRE